MLCPNVVVAGDKILEQFMSARDDDMLLCVKVKMGGGEGKTAAAGFGRKLLAWR